MAREKRMDSPGDATQRQAKISYCYDRLWEQKLAQVYHLLVPDQDNNNLSDHFIFNEAIEDTEYENGSHLHQSILGSAKGK